MNDFAQTVESALLEWWKAYGQERNLTMRFHPVIQQRIFDARPTTDPAFGSFRITQFLGMPILVDDSIPIGEIHIADKDGNRLGKITGLDHV
jgi:hypothetical protein